ncbi:MAG TPA: Asp-tRNA(Asn)/Glu-tRNA(Gln) amidotransferase subunit GatC [Acidimicrobiia bacterium]|nr:Asp-tRNA(Asn)/Glu-tRNA(Gln) amidotransferase subunit GatC [Acidimicrobiia bacterium]
MAPRITGDDVRHVAKLARLRIDDAEVDQFAGQLAAILDHAADIEALDIDDVPPTSHPVPFDNVLRADESGPCLDRDEVLAQAPHVEDGRFRVPRILDEAQ